MAAQIQTALVILRRKQVEARTGLSRSTLYAYISAGVFPTPYALGARAVGWRESEIEAWLAARIKQCRKAAQGAIMEKKNAQPSQAESGAQNNTHPHFADLSADAQRARLLDRLRIGPISTLEARRTLEILAPAARVFELKEQGHRIDTIRIREETETGIPHRVALYVLIGNAA